MCMFKSGIIMKDEIFVPDYDSHTDMLDALKIADTEKNAKTLFVRAELTPKNNDVFSPVDEWDYRVDQDILPDWYVAEYEEKRMRDAVKKWAETHIHIGKDNLVIDSGEGHYIKNCKNVEIRDSATVKEVCGSAIVASSPYTNWYNKEKVIISENATFKDRYTKTIWQSGDWKVNIVGGENNA